MTRQALWPTLAAVIRKCTKPLLAGLLLVQACALFASDEDPKEQVPYVWDADEATVAGCQYIRDLDATTELNPYTYGYKGLSAEDTAALKRDIRTRAGRMGATHLVWRNVSPVAVSARAYLCRKGARTPTVP